MKYQKGFTLIELLAVITIIGLLITIMVPNVQKFSANTKEKMLAAKYETLQDAALIYAEDIKTELKDDNDCYKTVTVKQLIDNEYIKSDGMDSGDQPIIINPVNKASLNDVGFCLYIKNNSVEALMYNNCPEYITDTASCWTNPSGIKHKTIKIKFPAKAYSSIFFITGSLSEKTATSSNLRWKSYYTSSKSYQITMPLNASEWRQGKFDFYDANNKLIISCVTKPYKIDECS